MRRVVTPVRFWVIGLVLLLVGVAALAATARRPSRQALLGELHSAAAPVRNRPSRALPIARRRSSGYLIAVSSSPNSASRPNRVVVTLVRHDHAVGRARVRIAFSMPSMHMWGGYTAVLAAGHGGRYAATVPVLGMAGAWQLRVAVAPRAGRLFRVTVTDRMPA